ncbi:MAG: SPFH domain-containing protein [Gammaproteobacteria bacterium]
MFNIRYIKVDPTTYLIKYKNGKLKRKGSGLAFWYFAPNTSLVAIPVGTVDQPFMLNEVTKDYQEVTVQGQVVYRITDPEKLARLMNFTLKANQVTYVSDDPEKLKNRIVNLVQVKMRIALEQLELRQALNASQVLVKAVKTEMINSEVMNALGIEIMDLSIMAIKPTPETARALEVAVREELLEEADEAIYRRRNASIEQERVVKENELQTELAVQKKEQEIEQGQLKAEQQLQEQRQAMVAELLVSEIAQEQQRTDLIDIATENERKQADANAYAVAGNMEALSKVDARVLEALTQAKMDPQQLMAQAFKELASEASKIGQLNIAPDLFQQLVGRND